MSSNTLNLSQSDIDSLQTLSPGSGIDIQFDLPTGPARLKTQYVGMDIPKCMFFQLPNTPKWRAAKEFLITDSQIVVRYVLEDQYGKVVAFKVNVLRIMTQPTSILITTFPNTIQSLGLRSDQRSQPGIAVQINFSSNGQKLTFKSIILDISRKGARLAVPVSNEFPLLDYETQVELVGRIGNDMVNIIGVIKNRDNQINATFYGVEFTSNKSGVEALLREYTLQP